MNRCFYKISKINGKTIYSDVVDVSAKEEDWTITFFASNSKLLFNIRKTYVVVNRILTQNIL